MEIKTIYTNFIIFLYVHHSWKKNQHPGNWLPSLWDKRNICLIGKENFLVAIVVEIFPWYDVHSQLFVVFFQL